MTDGPDGHVGFDDGALNTEDWKISRVNALRALHLGMDAGRAGEALTTCPFKILGPPAQRFLAIWWVKGWQGTQDPTFPL